MSYELEFLEEALAEWRRLDGSIKTQLKKKLAERLEEPRLPSAKLSGHSDRYKIKLRSVGYRLVYEVRDSTLVVSLSPLASATRTLSIAAETR